MEKEEVGLQSEHHDDEAVEETGKGASVGDDVRKGDLGNERGEVAKAGVHGTGDGSETTREEFGRDDPCETVTAETPDWTSVYCCTSRGVG